MSLRIRYACPHCKRRIVHHPELAGQLVICSACKGEFYEPTDPLPGKPAQKALQPQPNETRRLRVPEGGNPRHDLAVLARRDSSDMRTITEIVEAVLLDAEPALPEPSKSKPRADETMEDFGYLSDADKPSLPLKKTIEAWNPPPRKSSATQGPSPNTVEFKPLDESSPGADDGLPSKPAQSKPRSKRERPAPPPTMLAGPSVRPLVPPDVRNEPVVESPRSSRSSPKPAVPGAVPVPTAKPAGSPTLATASMKQMIEELRRRGFGVAMITCDMAPMRNHELAWSDNMTREDALAMIRKYLEMLKDPSQRLSSRSGMLKRMWKNQENS